MNRPGLRGYGPALRAAREHAGYRVCDVARETGIPRVSVSSIEAGKPLSVARLREFIDLYDAADVIDIPAEHDDEPDPAFGEPAPTGIRIPEAAYLAPRTFPEWEDPTFDVVARRLIWSKH